MEIEQRKCTDCKFRLAEDYGYSNYTVEGTTFHCLLKKHPDMPFDEFYGEDKRLEFAKRCDGFVAGKGVLIDCEHEECNYDDKLSSAYTKDPEIVPLLDAWEARAANG